MKIVQYWCNVCRKKQVQLVVGETYKMPCDHMKFNVQEESSKEVSPKGVLIINKIDSILEKKEREIQELRRLRVVIIEQELEVKDGP